MNDRTMIGILSILITENCNLKCRHCLRGENTNVDITNETIENTFSKIDEIGLLLITGGEPFYSKKTVAKIKKIIDEIKKNNIIVHQIQIVTNGTKYDEDIEQTLVELYDLALNKEKSSLLISSDIYHEEEIERLGLRDITNSNIKKFCDLANKICIRFDRFKPRYIFAWGRAQNLPESREASMISWDIVANNFNELENCARELNIMPDGSVTPHGQMSYDFMEQYKIFNINEQQDIMKILSEYTDSALCHLSYSEQLISLSEILDRNDIRMIFTR